MDRPFYRYICMSLQETIFHLPLSTPLTQVVSFIPRQSSADLTICCSTPDIYIHGLE